MLNLLNEFIFAPVKTGYSDGKGNVTEKHLNFYRARNKEIGAIIPEPLYLSPDLREIPTQIGIDDDQKLGGLRNLTAVIKEHGAKAVAHLNHPGRMSNPKIPGNRFISSTDKACENGGAIPVAMGKPEMDEVKELFVSAAVRAEKAGFDILELQFGHGYLLAQFLSPAVNDRKDEYGGSFTNRIKFPLEVLDSVLEAVSAPVIVRLSGDEMTPNGIKLEETVKLAEILADKGIAAIHVSAGTVCSTPPWYFQHMFIPKGKTWEFAEKIAEKINIPVIAVGKINRKEDIEKLKAGGKIKYLAVGRALVADPKFTEKIQEKNPAPIVPCLACSDGCLGGVKAGKGLGCVVNPLVGKEEYVPSTSTLTHNYAVVGGGLAGAEAAITLASKGHKVTLFEKDKIGGQFNLAYLPPKKESLKEIISYYETALKFHGIDIINKEAKESDLSAKKFDGVVLATGSLPAIPPIEGLKEYYWAEVLKDENIVSSKKVVVIGGGLIGTEVAHKLLKKDNEVIIIEMLPEIANGMEMIEKALTLKGFKEENIKIYTKTTVTKIDGKTVYAKNEEELIIKDVDLIIIATGMKSYNPLAEKLQDKIKFTSVGDAAQVGKAQDAIASGFNAVKDW